jgi:hypothetical protein
VPGEELPQQGRSEHIPAALWAAVEPILETIGSLTQHIREYDRQLEMICQEHYPEETDLLRQIEGVGALTALTFVLTLEDPYRFERSRSVGAYLGLVPARDQSGDRDPRSEEPSALQNGPSHGITHSSLRRKIRRADHKPLTVAHYKLPETREGPSQVSLSGLLDGSAVDKRP